MHIDIIIKTNNNIVFGHIVEKQIDKKILVGD
jgi:hypothetical protein